ncbi:MAG TPA: hypothetical protein VNO79_15705 [Actinomycetota bacterium]|nr:hypothetical protein [Actinomycetota bacterium]
MAKGRRSGPATEPRRLTKAERREQARLERERLRRAMARRQRNRRILTGALVVAAVALGAFLVLRPGEQRRASGGGLPGLLTTRAPWDANQADLLARLDRLGLPPVGGAMHIHAHLDLFVDGAPVAVPADVGITSSTHAPLHTHDASGVIHVESALARTFTLGEFFDVWGVRFTDRCLGGYCGSGQDRLRVFVDGDEVGTGFRDVPLEDGSEIVVAFGTRDELPDPIPSSYDFSGLQG